MSDEYISVLTGKSVHVGGVPSSWPAPVPVSERLPEPGERVLVYVTGVGWHIGKAPYPPNSWSITGWLLPTPVPVEAWLPLPPAPDVRPSA